MCPLATPNKAANLPPNNQPEYELDGTNEDEGNIPEAINQQIDSEDSSSKYESSEEEEEFEETEEPVQQPNDQEIDLTKGEINLSLINEVLATVLEESRTPSLDSDSAPERENPFPEHVSEESTPLITRRNTMASSSGPAEPTHVTLTAE